ncbi:MAG: hypothetical protein AB3N14_15045 [Flavobacteriaceae bacterium]
MRTQKLNFLLGMAFALLLNFSHAQSEVQAFWVHEDVIKPGMVPAYEAVSKELTDNMKTHQIKDLNVLVSTTSDNRYLWVSPISSLADVQRPVFKELEEKMGADNMKALFDKMDKCYDIEHNYVILLDKELSYMPGGITQTPEGQNYRKFHYFHYTPSNAAAVKQKVKDIKQLFESKGSKFEYRVYRSGFGTRGAFYMVAVAAKDAGDYAQRTATNNELLGEEWANMFNSFMGELIHYEQVEGSVRPDMGYSPTN